MTSKLQVTLPKAIASEYRIKPGDEILWVAAGEAIRVIPPGRVRRDLTVKERLALFDSATTRQRQREGRVVEDRRKRKGTERAWKREDLYEGRGRTR